MNPIHFSHANGFPAKSYAVFFESLSPFSVSYINKMGHSFDCYDGKLDSLVKELISELESKYNQPIIGIGHSTGGIITLLAAIERPDLFCNIILLDPPIFRSSKRLFSRLAQLLGLDKYFGPARSAKNRRERFNSKQEALARYSNKDVFKGFHDRCLADYVSHGFEENHDGVCLSFSREIEYKIFRLAQISYLPLNSLEVKGTVIFAKNSDLVSQKDVNWWLLNSNMSVLNFDGGHLFPLEQPFKTSSLIKTLI